MGNAADSLREAYARYLVEENKRTRSAPEPRTYVYASGYRDCAYAMFLDCRYPEVTADPDTLARFRRGDDFEAMQLSRLHIIGAMSVPSFVVISGQREAIFHDCHGHKIISGKIDSEIQFSGASDPAVLEIKSGESVKRIETTADMFRGRWTKQQIMQLLVYLLNLGLERGFMLLDRPGIPTILEVHLEDYLDEAEVFYARAERVCAALRGIIEPPEKLPGINCNICSHYHRCLPDEWLKTVDHITDPDIVEAAQILTTNAAAAKEHARAAELLKQRLRGVEAALIGDSHRYEGRWQASSSIPEDIRKQHSVRNEKGAWRGKVVPL